MFVVFQKWWHEVAYTVYSFLKIPVFFSSIEEETKGKSIVRKACTLLKRNELVRDNQLCEKLINWEQFWHRSYLGVSSLSIWAFAGYLWMLHPGIWWRDLSGILLLNCHAGFTLLLNCSQGPLKSHNSQVLWQGGHTRAHETRVAWWKEGTVPGKLIKIHCSGHLSQKKRKRAEKSAERCWPDGHVWPARNRSLVHWSMGLS